jgi:hypothetical protein
MPQYIVILIPTGDFLIDKRGVSGVKLTFFESPLGGQGRKAVGSENFPCRFVIQRVLWPSVGFLIDGAALLG